MKGTTGMSDFNEREEAIFDEAHHYTDPTQRAAYLDLACAGDPALRRRIDTLLSADERADNFLATDGQLPEAKTLVDTDAAELSEGPGDTIGKYKLLEQIGEGGMGVVYMAEQSVPFHKRVALKIIKLGMDTKAVVARFNAEYQALALMNHPCIAKVLDAGATDTGRPFFVMEYVRGIPITEYCDQHKLSTRQRLELFIPVCQAVQHAHQKGIIHRDIKPSNVLVANFDGRPAPMVIDFGIAKAVNQRLSQETFFTRHGQFIGTLEYIAPEQAEGSQIDIDTRADIYSLGVLLYQLLTGTTPFPGKRLRESAWRETMRIIQEEEPQKPSDRMSTLTAEQGTTIEKTHGGEAARKIGLVLRRELDLVVLKCLEKDRTRRYDTANGLAMELERYLKGEPVTAVPPKAGYLLAKFARKHKKTVAMAAAIAVILAGATVFSTWQAVRASRAEALTKKQVEKLAAINGWMNRDLLPQVNAWTGGEAGQNRSIDIKLKDAILQSAQRLSEDFKDHPEIEGEIRLTIGKALNALGMIREARDNLQKAIDLLKRTPEPIHTNTADAQATLGKLLIYVSGGSNADAVTRAMGHEGMRLLEDAFKTARAAAGGGHPFTIEIGFDVVTARTRYDESGAALLADELLDIAGKMPRENNSSWHRIQAKASLALCQLRLTQQRIPEARQALKTLQEARRQSSAGKLPDPITPMESLVESQLDGFLQLNWDSNPDTAEATLRAGLEKAVRLVGDGNPVEGFLIALRSLCERRDAREGLHQYAKQLADLNLRAYGTNGGMWTLNTLRYVASIPATIADWPEAARTYEHYRLARGITNGTLLALEALTKHLAGEKEVSRELRAAYWQMLQQNLSEPDNLSGLSHSGDLSALKAALLFPCSPSEMRIAVRGVEHNFANQGTQPWWKINREGETLMALLQYRLGEWHKSVEIAEKFLSETGTTRRVALVPLYVLALAQAQIGDEAAARATLSAAERVLDKLIARGVTGSYEHSYKFWEPVAAALVLREEAANTANIRLGKPKATPKLLKENRVQWLAVRALIDDANRNARGRRYAAAAASFDAAIAHPQFNWLAAHEDFDFLFHRVFTSKWGAGDCEGHVAILNQMHEGASETETPYLFQLSELNCPLPPELSIRRSSSQARRRLASNWARKQEQDDPLGEDTLALGMVLFREGRFEEARKVLSTAKTYQSLQVPTAAMVFSAMAHWRLENRDEARRLLKEADERFNQTVIVPGEGMFPPWFPNCIMMEMVIKEADALIDPGVDNAPHVAALPPEGW